MALLGIPTISPEVSDALVHLSEAAAAVAFIVYKARATEGRQISDAGFARRGVLGETATGFVIGFALISAVLALLKRLGLYDVISINSGFELWLPLLTYFGVAVFEETIFRGVIFRVAEYRYGSLIALVASSAVFGLLHIINVIGEPIPFDEKLIGPLLICIEAGLLLGAAYMATRRLWLPIGIHWAWNFFEGPVYGAHVSGNANPRNVLIDSSLHGPFLLTGGSFGPEGSVVCAAVGLAFGAGMLWIAVRRGEWKQAGGWMTRTAPVPRDSN